jgi:hypothetical protein
MRYIKDELGWSVLRGYDTPIISRNPSAMTAKSIGDLVSFTAGDGCSLRRVLTRRKSKLALLDCSSVTGEGSQNSHIFPGVNDNEAVGELPDW